MITLPGIFQLIFLLETGDLFILLIAKKSWKLKEQGSLKFFSFNF